MNDNTSQTLNACMRQPQSTPSFNPKPESDLLLNHPSASARAPVFLTDTPSLKDHPIRYTHPHMQMLKMLGTQSGR